MSFAFGREQIALNPGAILARPDEVAPLSFPNSYYTAVGHANTEANRDSFSWLDHYVYSPRNPDLPGGLAGWVGGIHHTCLLYTSPSPRDTMSSRMPSSA